MVVIKITLADEGMIFSHFDSTLSCPLLHESLFRHLDIKLFNCSARVLWDNLPTIADPDRIQAVILLLLRIHSRLPNDPSSEVEDTIISDITSDHKVV